MIELIALFLSAFLAATILPASSEIILTSLNIQNNHNQYLLVAIATIGNVLGSVVNWFMGYYFIKLKNRKWFPIKKNKIYKYSIYYHKWGTSSLLFAWLPIIGDPLTIIAGIFKTNFYLFLILVTIGKMGRYLFLISIT
jgi:membrane protein YqaA with SNARE-associated domain